MNFPSLSFVWQHARDSFRRFPFAILAASVAVISIIWLIEADSQGKDPYHFLYKTASLAILGISLFTAIVVTAERWRPDTRTLLLSQLAGWLLLAACFLLLPEDLPGAPAKHAIRLALFFAGTHLLVAVAPFVRKGSINGFWQYNKVLFLRLLTAALYANVLFAGLAAALLSIDALLGVEIEGVRYAQLWVLVFIMFTTSFFLAGVPDDLAALDQKTDYPGGLKLFTQYVLLPLVSIYVIILYLYAGRIILNQSWPEGWVANLILGFSIIGILSLLLLHPVRERAESTWVQRFSKRYYLVLLPLVVMLLLAIWRRISEYGITENRYFVLIAGIWLGGMALYFLLSEKQNIKIIPASLAVLVFLVSFGPWGAISVSENSQIQRLKTTLEEHGLLADGTIRAGGQQVPPEDLTEISAGIRYLYDVHGLDEIQPWFGQDLNILADTIASESQIPQRVVELMGLEYIHAWEHMSEAYRYFSSASGPIRMDDSRWLISHQRFDSRQDTSLVTLGARTFVFRFQPDSMLFGIWQQGDETPLIEANLSVKANHLAEAFPTQQSHAIPADQMIIEQENESARLQLLLRHLNTKKEPSGWRLESLEMDVLLTIK